MRSRRFRTQVLGGMMQARASVELMTEALELIVKALHLLDEAEAPGDIGAHVDLARERLSRALEMTRVSSTYAQHAAGRPVT